jgi:cystathionine beta-synthase
MFAALEVARDCGPDDVMVVILPDSGRGYLSKLYNQSWMLQYGFIDRPGTQALIGEVLQAKRSMEPEIPDMVVLVAHEKVGRAIDTLQHYGISQLPVAKREDPDDISEIVGSIHDRSLLDRVFRDREAIERDLVEVMDPPLPVVQMSDGLEDMFDGLSRGAEAIVVADGAQPLGVLSRADLLEFLAHQTR